MKTLFTFILAVIFLNTFGQSNVSYLFYDACTQKVIEPPYFIHDFESDTSIIVEKRKSIDLASNYYQIEAQMNRNEMLTSFWFDLYLYEQSITDTLYLQKPRFFGPKTIHPKPEEFKYYCCGELCNGTIEEIDTNGIIRFKGQFSNGIPTSNLKYYNSTGHLFRTEVYVNGQLERIK
ncbi:toxin-antitoxin system YwqK family antitoxin [Marinigracilibium pacificum]|uniref:MORN repeat protein n=1 Tax=Marinigracilibium pacificum TaxID=2729599 RepID=A0A848J062_9BACT|nr:hypothetical protein [Marinigracilibium pacificum]NMM47649.1 hypothetical protein [Marinigracilibium pacificum]